MIYNRRQPDGTFPPLAGFFDRESARDSEPDNRILGTLDGEIVTGQDAKDAIARLRASKGRIRSAGDDNYSPDCSACLRGLRHTDTEHEAHLRRNQEASRGDW